MTFRPLFFYLSVRGVGAGGSSEFRLPPVTVGKELFLVVHELFSCLGRVLNIRSCRREEKKKVKKKRLAPDSGKVKMRKKQGESRRIHSTMASTGQDSWQ